MSFRPTGEPVLLVQWAGEASWPLEMMPIDLRARYCGWGMDQARQADTILAGEPELDRYLLQFWPASPAPDQVLKQTSANAAYWHRYAQELPPPPSAEEKARMAGQAERHFAAPPAHVIISGAVSVRSAPPGRSYERHHAHRRSLRWLCRSHLRPPLADAS